VFRGEGRSLTSSLMGCRISESWRGSTLEKGGARQQQRVTFFNLKGSKGANY